MTMRPRTLVVGTALLAANAWLAVAIGTHERPALASIGATASSPALDVPAVRPRPAAPEASLARPIFRPDRRPLQGAAPVAVRSLDAGGFVLQATLVRRDRAAALIRIDDASEPGWVTAGERLEGWLVLAIEPDRASLERDGVRVDLVMGVRGSDDGRGLASSR